MSKIQNVEMTDKEVKDMILLNMTKMFIERGTFKKENIDKIHDKLRNNLDDNLTVYIDCDNGVKMGIILIMSKLTSVNKNNVLKEFVSQDDNIKKIVILKKTDSTKKLFNDLFNNYKSSEVFMDYEFLQNLIDHAYVPEHALLTGSDRDDFLKIHQEKSLKTIFATDRVARYYGMKHGDICKIRRVSPTSGYMIDYKKIVSGKVDDIFF
jgi:DNA-directed RNA polymerase subunit H (RpoH/RPB5)